MGCEFETSSACYVSHIVDGFDEEVTLLEYQSDGSVVQGAKTFPI